MCINDCETCQNGEFKLFSALSSWSAGEAEQYLDNKHDTIEHRVSADFTRMTAPNTRKVIIVDLTIMDLEQNTEFLETHHFELDEPTEEYVGFCLVSSTDKKIARATSSKK